MKKYFFLKLSKLVNVYCLSQETITEKLLYTLITTKINHIKVLDALETSNCTE